MNLVVKSMNGNINSKVVILLKEQQNINLIYACFEELCTLSNETKIVAIYQVANPIPLSNESEYIRKIYWDLDYYYIIKITDFLKSSDEVISVTEIYKRYDATLSVLYTIFETLYNKNEPKNEHIEELIKNNEMDNWYPYRIVHKIQQLQHPSI